MIRLISSDRFRWDEIATVQQYLSALLTHLSPDESSIWEGAAGELLREHIVLNWRHLDGATQVDSDDYQFDQTVQDMLFYAATDLVENAVDVEQVIHFVDWFAPGWFDDADMDPTGDIRQTMMFHLSGGFAGLDAYEPDQEARCRKILTQMGEESDHPFHAFCREADAA